MRGNSRVLNLHTKQLRAVHQTNDQKCGPEIWLNVKVYWLIILSVWCLRAFVCLCLWDIAIAAGWSNICFKDVLQAHEPTNQADHEALCLGVCDMLFACVFRYGGNSTRCRVSFSCLRAKSFIRKCSEAENHRERKRNVWEQESTNGCGWRGMSVNAVRPNTLPQQNSSNGRLYASVCVLRKEPEFDIYLCIWWGFCVQLMIHEQNNENPLKCINS